MLDSRYEFVAISNPDKKLDYFFICEDDKVNYEFKVTDYKSALESQIFKLKSLFSLDKFLISYDAYKKHCKDNGIQAKDISKFFNDYKMEKSVHLDGEIKYMLNCSNKISESVLKKDELMDCLHLEVYKDVLIKYEDRKSEKSEILKDYFDRVEGGNYILYYLNEFRHNRKIPCLIFIGIGGSGKSTCQYMFASYKKEYCDHYFKEKYTGNFGKTSLIIEEEPEDKTSDFLTLNAIKNLITKNCHARRVMQENPSNVYGYATVLFSANDNDKSKLKRILNEKGEDVSAIKRRISTFRFGESCVEFFKTTGNMEKLQSSYKRNHDNKEPTELDKHLNWLEDTGAFSEIKTAPGQLFPLFHVNTISICSDLTPKYELYLEYIYEKFVIEEEKTIPLYENENKNSFYKNRFEEIMKSELSKSQLQQQLDHCSNKSVEIFETKKIDEKGKRIKTYRIRCINKELLEEVYKKSIKIKSEEESNDISKELKI